MVIYSHSLYVFELVENDRILLFKWTDKNESMEDEDYQAALHNYAGFVLEYKTPGLIVDLRNFKKRIGPELNTWWNENIAPRYAKAGVNKFAYWVPGSFLEKMAPGEEMYKHSRGFFGKYLASYDQAVLWLTE